MFIARRDLPWDFSCPRSCLGAPRVNEVRILGTSDPVMANQSGSPAVGSLNHLATTVAVRLARGYQ